METTVKKLARLVLEQDIAQARSDMLVALAHLAGAASIPAYVKEVNAVISYVEGLACADNT